ncbi:hypothetical protein [uncultured Gimesia sp.]|uniref:hypothetical protein n=1 Tax=uncultured Gimesia sp. TaxID=1678688 RepID=UPI002627BCDA|nr:hypothetical protein [uncultured Gimesia sp.]
MADYHVYRDYSGTMKSDVFYELAVPMDSDIAELEYHKAEGWEYISKCSPTELELAEEGRRAWLECGIVNSKNTKQKKCPSDQSHVTEEYFSDLEVELWHSEDQEVLQSEFNLTRPWFEMPRHEQALIVTASFAEQIRQSGLTGAGFVPVKIKDPDGPAEKSIPQLFALQYQGTKCLRPFRVQGAKNACPFCGHGPLICQECGFPHFSCPECNHSATTPKDEHKGPADKTLILSPPEQREILVLDGSRWDGSDFVYVSGNSELDTNVVSKRALDWLISIHAAPFCARPVQFCIDGMTDQQLQQLDVVQKPILT